MARPRLDPAIHEASGAYAKNPQRRPENIPEYVAGSPEIPRQVSENEQALWFWNWACKVLSEAGVLTTSMLPLLTMKCLDWSQMMWLYESTKEGNVWVSNNKGNVSVSPDASQLHQFANRFLKELQECGLTPASKTKVVASPTNKEDDPFVEMLNRRMKPKSN